MFHLLIIYFDTFRLMSLCKWVQEGTFVDSNNILDLMLTNEIDRVGDVCVLEPLPSCRHCSAIVLFCNLIMRCN